MSTKIFYIYLSYDFHELQYFENLRKFFCGNRFIPFKWNASELQNGHHLMIIAQLKNEPAILERRKRTAPNTKWKRGQVAFVDIPLAWPHSLLDLYFRPYAECFKPANKNIYSYSALNNLEHQKNNTKSPTNLREKGNAGQKPSPTHIFHIISLGIKFPLGPHGSKPKGKGQRGPLLISCRKSK